jgi:hypothetical protein
MRWCRRFCNLLRRRFNEHEPYPPHRQRPSHWVRKLKDVTPAGVLPGGSAVAMHDWRKYG